jgi:hypothetical protein
MIEVKRVLPDNKNRLLTLMGSGVQQDVLPRRSD